MMNHQILPCLLAVLSLGFGQCTSLEELDGESGGSPTADVQGFGQPLTAVTGAGEVTLLEGDRRLCSFRTAKPNVEETRWVEEQEKIAVKSRGNHGPATIELFDSRSGSLLGSVLAYEAGAGPAWAQALAE